MSEKLPLGYLALSGFWCQKSYQWFLAASGPFTRLVLGGDPATFSVPLLAFDMKRPAGSAGKSMKAMKAMAAAMKAMKVVPKAKAAKAMKAMKAMKAQRAMQVPAMKSTKATKSTKVMKRPAGARPDNDKKKDDDRKKGFDKNKGVPWAKGLDPHHVAGRPELMYEVSILVNGRFVSSMSSPAFGSLAQMVREAEVPGCDRVSMGNPSIAVNFEPGPKLPDSSDDDKKDDDRADDDKKKNDDTGTDDKTKDDDSKADDGDDNKSDGS